MHLSFWGLLRVILIRDLKLYGWRGFFCSVFLLVLLGFFFPYEVIQHLPDHLLINKHMKKSTDLRAQEPEKHSAAQEPNLLCSSSYRAGCVATRWAPWEIAVGLVLDILVVSQTRMIRIMSV